MVSLQTPVCDFGKPAVDFSLPGTDGKVWTLEDCRGKKGLLVMFICNHCPYVKAVLDRLVRDTRELRELGVNSVAIMSNDPHQYEEDSFENMQKIAREKDFPFPYLLDATQEVAKAYGAVCTPDFFGYNADLQLQYRGRLAVPGAPGRQPQGGRTEDARRDLFEAMKHVAETGKGPEVQIPSMGCSIKWLGE
ncbi:thioredoxin family protein [Thiolapillus sp.]|uniref:thioredoxin family protein n=4 Tax=Thiolapillus sp. TaxID=2017437 RepID=UPI0025D3E3B0|nr:thioredoxin family protein [Thiolapillus sp.]